MAAANITFALLFLVACGAVCGGAEWHSSMASPGRLNAVWSGVMSGFLNITQLDPSTGAHGEVLFSSSQMMQMLAVSPAVDVRGKRLFVPLVVSEVSGALAVFDLSTPGKARLQKSFTIPGEFLVTVQYDSVRNMVWLFSTTMNAARDVQNLADDPGIEINITSVDLWRGTVQSVGVLPPGVLPARGIALPAVIDEKNREMVFSALLRQNHTYALAKFNLDTHKLVTVPLPDMFPSAMAKDVESGTVYALLQQQQIAPLSFGTVNTVTGKIHVINQWNNTDLEFPIGSLAAYDSSSAQFYSLLGPGTGPPVAVVTVSARSGQLEHAVYMKGYQQPTGLFVI